MPFYIGLSLLSNNEPKGKALPGLLSAEGRRVLSFLAGRPLKEEEIAKDENGRPFLPGSLADFSISHSGAMAAVSLATGESRRTGCDIQIARSRASAREIAEVFFAAPERDYIFPRDGRRPDESRFFAIWALKECYLKLRGLSVFDMAQAPSFVSGGRFAFGEAVSTPLSFYLYELDGFSGERYFLAAALEGAEPAAEASNLWFASRGSPPEQSSPEIRWLSQSFLPCRSIAEIKAALSPARTVSPKM